MGARQSTPKGTNEDSEAARTCYYDLLGVSRLASDEEIKKAYRKKALELHPDRNHGDVLNATRRFAEVQTAYEVLSDSQERAWYDSHREAILNNTDLHDESNQPRYFNNIQLTRSEDLVSLMRQFKPTIDFTDGPAGFFGILNKTFDQLVAEEAAAAELGPNDYTPYPSFGTAKDSGDAVKQFYNAWSGFSTRKSFAWMDKYRLSEATDRRERRLMERENKKLRNDALREFNETVRFFVGFVRKRDPRATAEATTAAEKQKLMKDASAAQAAKSRAANQRRLAEAGLPVAAPSTVDEPEAPLLSESDDSLEAIRIECVACNKVFKSEKQFESHEKSKKHKKALKQVAREMNDDEANIGSDAFEPTRENVTTQDGHGQARGDSSGDEHSDTGSIHHKQGHTSRGPDTDTREDTSSGDDLAASAEVDPVIRESAKDEGPLDSPQKHADGPLASTFPVPKRKGKAKLRREQKAAREAQNGERSLKCARCGQVFASRTNLFSHLRALGHAQI